MGVALSGGCHALSSWKAYFVEFYGRAAGFWLFDFYDLSRNQFLSYSQFQYVKLKLKSRAFCWLIVWFCIGNGSFTILNLVGFSFCLTHPVINIYSFFNDFFSFDIANNVINIGDFLMKFILFDRFDMMCQKQTGFAIDQQCIASVIMGWKFLRIQTVGKFARVTESLTKVKSF